MEPSIKHRVLALLLVAGPVALAFIYPAYFVLAIAGVALGVAAYGLYITVLCWIIRRKYED